jgi:4-hydroxybenzoate polyprenyltransferase
MSRTDSLVRLEHPTATVLNALRVRQWVKNLLLFVPLLLAHAVGDPQAWLAAVLGFVAFSLCASAAYVVNDLVDREADRVHPTKRDRPFASGALPPLAGFVMAPSLLLIAFAVAWLALPALFLVALATYVIVTLAYSFALKRMAIVDVLVLAGLYALRVLAGGAATDIPVSEWLLAFSMFFFLSLALLKRYAELRLIELAPGASLAGRAYQADDLALLRTTGPSAGFISVLVLALYVTSPEVVVLYQRPALLWLVGAFLLYWVLRIWTRAHRGEMHDDPVLFAARDRASYVVAVLTGITLLAASL